MLMTNVLLKKNYDTMSLEDLRTEIEFMTRGSSTEGIATDLYRAIATYIIRVINNIKATFRWSKISRTAITTYIESNAYALKKAKENGYQLVYKRPITVYTWNVPIDKLPQVFTENINRIEPVRAVSATADLLASIVSMMKGRDSRKVIETSERINAVLFAEEIPQMFNEIQGISNTKISSNRVSFGDIFNSMQSFEDTVKRALNVEVRHYNESIRVGDILEKRIYKIADTLIEQLEKQRVVIDSDSIRQVSKTFVSLDRFLQYYGTVLKELNAFDAFIVDAIATASKK